MKTCWRPRTLGGICLVVLGASLTTGRVEAIPPPMSAADLVKKSDVIATVRVLGVACTRTEMLQRTGEALPVWQAWVQIVEVDKGSCKKGDTLLIEWKDISRKLLGPWKVDYFPGEVVQTHLHWNPEQRVYTTTWWNAKNKPIEKAPANVLPRKPGEVLVRPSADRKE